MRSNYGKQYLVALFFIVLVINTIDLTIIQSTPLGTQSSLPDPLPVYMTVETSIFRRGSMRDYSTEQITEEELSTILWAAYGFTSDTTRTISPINERFGIHIYVLIKNGTSFDVFTYRPENHSLLYVKQYRSIQFGQYRAPVYIGIVYDTLITTKEDDVGLIIGQIGQNIQLVTNALNLGSVINVDTHAFGYDTYSLARIGLPPNEIPMLIIPLGHPDNDYNFKYRPWDFSPLPRIQVSDTSLSTALQERQESSSFEGTLTTQEQNQMIWSTYGYSYYLDKTEQDFSYQIYRHRTIPSAHGLYPCDMYAITDTGIYQYYPNILPPLIEQSVVDFVGLPIISYYQKITKGDHRDAIAEACDQPEIRTAPLIIVPILEHTRTRETDPLWLWYYEIGSAAQNIFLEAAAWNLKTNIYTVNDPSLITSVLNLNEEEFLPLLVIPVGE